MVLLFWRKMEDLFLHTGFFELYIGVPYPVHMAVRMLAKYVNVSENCIH